MNLKQKLSLFSAAVLPALALSAYFLVSPARARASSCDPPQCSSPCFNGGCGNGAGGCFSNGSDGEPYVFCWDSPDGGSNGPGQCTDGCVTCEYGSYCS